MTFEAGLFIATIVCFALVAIAAVLHAIAIHGWPQITVVNEIMSSKETDISDSASETVETAENSATRHNRAASARHNAMQIEAGQGDKKHIGGEPFDNPLLKLADVETDNERYRRYKGEQLPALPAGMRWSEEVERWKGPKRAETDGARWGDGSRPAEGVPPFYLPEQDPGAFERLVDAARSGQEARQPNPHVSLTPSTRAVIAALVKIDASHKVGMVALLASAFGVKPGGSVAYVQLRQAFIDEQARNSQTTDEPTGELVGNRAVRRDDNGRFVVDTEGNTVRLDGTGAEQAEHT